MFDIFINTFPTLISNHTSSLENKETVGCSILRPAAKIQLSPTPDPELERVHWTQALCGTGGNAGADRLAKSGICLKQPNQRVCLKLDFSALVTSNTSHSIHTFCTGYKYHIAFDTDFLHWLQVIHRVRYTLSALATSNTSHSIQTFCIGYESHAIQNVCIGYQ